MNFANRYARELSLGDGVPVIRPGDIDEEVGDWWLRRQIAEALRVSACRAMGGQAVQACQDIEVDEHDATTANTTS